MRKPRAEKVKWYHLLFIGLAVAFNNTPLMLIALFLIMVDE